MEWKTLGLSKEDDFLGENVYHPIKVSSQLVCFVYFVMEGGVVFLPPSVLWTVEELHHVVVLIL